MTSTLKAKIFTLGEWYSCRGLSVVANSGVWTLGFRSYSNKLQTHMITTYDVLLTIACDMFQNRKAMKDMQLAVLDAKDMSKHLQHSLRVRHKHKLGWSRVINCLQSNLPEETTQGTGKNWSLKAGGLLMQLDYSGKCTFRFWGEGVLK